MKLDGIRRNHRAWLGQFHVPPGTRNWLTRFRPTKAAWLVGVEAIGARRKRARSGRRRFRWLVGSILIWLAGWATLDAAEPPSTNAVPPATLEGIARAMSGMKTVCARFVQERHLSLFQEPLRSEGVLCCEKPGHVRWEITRPYRSVLVSDGAGVAQFEWMDGRWQRLDLGLADAMQHVVGQIAGVIEGRYAGSRREFAITIAPSEAGPVLTLVPEQEKMRRMMQAIEVHLAPDLKGTRRVVLRENNADFTEIRFEDQVIDARLPAGTFDRTQPTSLESVTRAVFPARP